MKTSMKILYDYIVEMEDNYMKMSKNSKDKDFKKGVDAILTATTLIRVQMKDGGFQLEKKQIINAHTEGINDLKEYELNGAMDFDYPRSGEQYFNEKYKKNNL
jgi:hypothetical protein